MMVTTRLVVKGILWWFERDIDLFVECLKKQISIEQLQVLNNKLKTLLIIDKKIKIVVILAAMKLLIIL